MSLPFLPQSSYGQITRLLGKGAYGSVVETEKGYAIKIEKKDDGDITSSGLREIVSLLKVNSPYVIPVVDVILEMKYSAPGEVFASKKTGLVIPLAEASLAQMMGGKSLDIRKASQQLCLGLADIHNANLLHLDLKPENVLIHAGGNLWIADLGLSTVHACALPENTDEVFTLWYRAPELLLGGPQTTKGDVWALGVIIAEMMISSRVGSQTRLFAGPYKSTLSAAENEVNQATFLFSQFNVPLDSPLRKLPRWRDRYADKIRIPSKFVETLQGYNLSKEEISFLEWILNPDYIRRPTVFDVLLHPYINITTRKEITCDQILRLYSDYPDNKWGSLFSVRGEVIAEMLKISAKVRPLPLADEAISLAVYLLDRVVIAASPVTKEEIETYAGAALLIGKNFYDPVNTLSIDLFGDDEVEKKLIRAINTIYRLTVFDLAVATSYFFLLRETINRPNVRKIAAKVWRAALFVPSYFDMPEDVSDAIIALVDLREVLTPMARQLGEEIMASKYTQQDVMTLIVSRIRPDE
jgi:serine/threonine protein kinase